MRDRPIQVLFTGYAPVHFVCFRPLYERLVATADVEIHLSGGLRAKVKGGYEYDERGLYEPLGVPGRRILSVADLESREFDVLFAANTKMISPPGAPRRVQIFHGISFRNRAIRPENNADYYFIVGPYMRRRCVECGFLSGDDPRALSIGFMKTDRLLNGALDRQEWLDRFGFSGRRPVVLYAPTGQRYNSLEIMGEEALTRLIAADRFDILIKLHDHPKDTSIDWTARLGALEGDHVRIAREPDVVPLLSLADLLITDASSVSSEYALLDRPIVFLDVPKLLARASKVKGSVLDLETWGRRGGIIVERPEDVTTAVDAAISDPQAVSAIRRSMAADLFYNPGKATDVAFDWFVNEFLAPESSSQRAGPVAGEGSGMEPASRAADPRPTNGIVEQKREGILK